MEFLLSRYKGEHINSLKNEQSSSPPLQECVGNDIILLEKVRPGDDRAVAVKQNENVVSPQPSVRALEGK